MAKATTACNRVATAVLCLGLACSQAGTEPSIPQFAVHGLLFLGEPTQVVIVERTLPTDGFLDPDPRPLAPEDVTLELVEAGTTTIVPFVVDPANPLRFVANLNVEANRTYMLRGTVAGQPVMGRTTMPGALDFVAPSPDTTFLSGAPEDPGITLTWRHTAFAYHFRFGVGRGPFNLVRTDTTTLAFPQDFRDSVTTLSVVGLNADGNDFFSFTLDRSDARAIGNIAGAVGVLGGAALGTRTFVVNP